jgi:hypothetical protein
VNDIVLSHKLLEFVKKLIFKGIKGFPDCNSLSSLRGSPSIPEIGQNCSWSRNRKPAKNLNMTNEHFQVLTVACWIFGPSSEWFWTMLSFATLAVSIFLIYRQLNIQTASHIVQTICTLNDKWNNPKMEKIRNKVCKKLVAKNNEFNGDSECIAEFFEDIATFVRIKALSNEIVWDTMSWNVECYWPMFKDGVAQMRQDYGDVPTYEGFEKLFNDMVKISKQKGSSEKRQIDIDDFLKREIESTN